MRSLYSHAHRNKVLTLLSAFKLETNLKESKLLLNAIQFILENKDVSGAYYPSDLTVPTDKIIPSNWHDAVVEIEVKKKGNKQITTKKINRANYELAVLETFRKQLRCKMIWIEGAYRYRDPNQDLPKDFDENREYYYNFLCVPLDVREFMTSRRNKLDSNLKTLNETISDNEKVSITKRNGGHIRISPYQAQAEAPNIKQLHRDIKKEWPSINLIDVLKEAELDIEFTNLFHTVASRENLSEEVLRFRLILCLYAIGTNAGIKAVSAANISTNESNLRVPSKLTIQLML